MKKLQFVLLFVATAALLFSLPACNGFSCKRGSGKQTTEMRKVVPFSKIDISGSYKVIIKQDTGSALSITADDNLMKYIKSDVSGDKLTIHSTRSICASGQFVLNITMKDISAIRTSGAVDVSATNKITTKNIEFDLSGATKITLDLNADRVDTHGSGLTELNLTGQASQHNVDIAGSGQLNALDFVVAKYSIETSGASHCKINVLNQLDVNSSGASDVEYRGNPSSVNNNKSGASSLKKVD